MTFGGRSPRSALIQLGGALLLGGTAFLTPAAAQDKPTLKDVLGRVQSEGDTKAVEDLVGKLKGVSRKPAPSPTGASDPASPQGSAAGPPPTDPTLQPPADSAVPTRPFPAARPKVVSPATPAPKPMDSKSPSARADEAVRRAEAKDAPSVDLEILFEYDSSQITPKSVALLDTLGRALSDARLAQDEFLIAGHTDGKGAADYNLALSQRRAEAVRRYLITKFKINAARLTAKGYAAQHLKNTADPLAAENRRVQIVNLSKDKQ
jgi:outer membrane protein OmpA-like peptidoglycan-associated protein